MGSIVITGPNGKPFPSNCTVRVESMPGWHLLFNDQVSGTLTLPVSPGKYIYSITKVSKGAKPGGGPFFSYKEHGEILHECTEEQWTRLSAYEPKLARCRQTTSGITWSCGYFGCSENTTSKIAALEHEAQHFGHSLLEHVDEVEEAQEKAYQRQIAQSRAKENSIKEVPLTAR